MAKHRTQEEKEELIRLFKNSGLSRTDFCNTRNISPISLRNWMKAETQRPITFMQVVEPTPKKVSASMQDANIQLEFKDMRVTLPIDTTPDIFRENNEGDCQCSIIQSIKHSWLVVL